MENLSLKWKVKDRQKLLLAVFEKMPADSSISFEGDLSNVQLEALNGVSIDETDVLRRNTISPRQDLLVVPLASNRPEAVLRALGGTVPRAILHVQIATPSSLAFGAYDNFQHVMFGESISESLLDELARVRIIERIH